MSRKNSDEYIKLKYDLLKKVRKFRKEKRLTWHEVPDGHTMQLIPASIHKACPHSGAVELCKYAYEYEV